MTRKAVTSYVLCLKWKPEEECTIDFKVYLDDDHEPGQTTRRVRLCSKYRADETTEVNLYHVLCGMYGSPGWGRRSLTPQDQHQPQPRRNVQKPEEVLSIGDKVTAKVISVSAADRKIGLSLKRAQWTADPEEDAAREEKAQKQNLTGGMDTHGAMGTDKITFGPGGTKSS